MKYWLIHRDSLMNFDHLQYIGGFPEMGVPPNHHKSSIFIGCSLINHPANGVVQPTTSINQQVLNTAQVVPKRTAAAEKNLQHHWGMGQNLGHDA
jgi:hypothetical protein